MKSAKMSMAHSALLVLRERMCIKSVQDALATMLLTKASVSVVQSKPVVCHAVPKDVCNAQLATTGQRKRARIGSVQPVSRA